MSAAARDSPGTIHANLESTDDEVVFLFEEIGHTRRNRALPPRSNSAGEPIVISSDEEDMTSRHPHPPTLYSPLPRRHRHRCLERSRPHHHYHRSPSTSGKHRPSPRGEKWRDHTHSRPGQDDTSVAHRRLHDPMDYYAYRVHVHSYNGKKTSDRHKVESRSRVSRPSHGSPSPSMGYSTESSFSRQPTSLRFTPPPPPRVTPPPLPRFTTSPPPRFTPPPPPRITPPPPPRFTPPPPPRSTTPPSPRFISPLRRHNGHTPSRTPLPASTHPNGVTRKKLIVEYTIPPARKRKRADSPGQDSEVKRKKHESSYSHSHHHPHSHYSHSHHPHPHTHSHHPHTHHSPSHTSPILNGTKSNLDSYKNFDGHKNLNSDRHKTSSTSSFSAANNRHHVKVKSESPTPEKKVEKRKRERGKDLPQNSTGHTLIKQESSNRAHPSPEPSLTPDHRPNLHPSSLLLASAARTRPFTSASKTPPSLPSKSRTRLKLSLERGKRVQGKEFHKPQMQTPHREEKGETGTGKGTTSRSSPQEMCRRKLPGMCPAQSQGPCEPQTLASRREEKESRRGTVEKKDATPGMSPRRMNCHRPPCTSPAKSQATPTRQTQLESYLLLDPDATPPLKQATPTLKQATPTQSQQEFPASSMAQHYPSTATTLVTSPVSPPPEEGMPFPPPSLPAAGGVGGAEDHLRHSVAIPPWTTDELKEKSKPLSSPSVDPLLPGLCAVSLEADGGTPYTNFSWNALDTCAQAMEGRDGKRCEQYVCTLEELTSRGCFIPGHHLEAVLRTVLNLTNTGLLLRVHSVLVSDAALRTTTGLSASLLWDLMELCCTKLSQGLTTPANGSAGASYPLSAHVVLLYLAALLVKDLASSGTEMDSSLVERTLSLTSKWQHVLVVLDLLFKLLPNDPSPSSLPDLCSVLSVLVCLSVMTSQECDQDNGTSRLARELSLRVARLPTTHLKMHFLLLLPCHLLREKVINIHFSTEFLLPQASSQNCGLASDHVSFELIADSHLRRAPYHHDGTPHDLSLFLFLQCNLLQSHCAQLLGLYPDHTHWTTPPTSAPLSPAQLANQLQPIASQIRALPRRLSEDLALLTDLTSPLCWFHLQILERLTSCGQQ